MAKRAFTEGSWRRDPLFRALVHAFMTCRQEKECEDFLRDIATLSELHAFGERLECAKLLVQGHTQREVAEKTGSSTTTVNRVAQFLANGSGYRAVLKGERCREAGEAKKQMETVEGGKGRKAGSLLRKYL